MSSAILQKFSLVMNYMKTNFKQEFKAIIVAKYIMYNKLFDTGH